MTERDTPSEQPKRNNSFPTETRRHVQVGASRVDEDVLPNRVDRQLFQTPPPISPRSTLSSIPLETVLSSRADLRINVGNTSRLNSFDEFAAKSPIVFAPYPPGFLTEVSKLINNFGKVGAIQANSSDTVSPNPITPPKVASKPSSAQIDSEPSSIQVDSEPSSVQFASTPRSAQAGSKPSVLLDFGSLNMMQERPLPGSFLSSLSASPQFDQPTQAETAATQIPNNSAQPDPSSSANQSNELRARFEDTNETPSVLDDNVWIDIDQSQYFSDEDSDPESPQTTSPRNPDESEQPSTPGVARSNQPMADIWVNPDTHEQSSIIFVPNGCSSPTPSSPAPLHLEDYVPGTPRVGNGQLWLISAQLKYLKKQNHKTHLKLSVVERKVSSAIQDTSTTLAAVRSLESRLQSNVDASSFENNHGLLMKSLRAISRQIQRSSMSHINNSGHIGRRFIFASTTYCILLYVVVCVYDATAILIKPDSTNPADIRYSHPDRFVKPSLLPDAEWTLRAFGPPQVWDSIKYTYQQPSQENMVNIITSIYHLPFGETVSWFLTAPLRFDAGPVEVFWMVFAPFFLGSVISEISRLVQNRTGRSNRIVR